MVIKLGLGDPPLKKDCSVTGPDGVTLLRASDGSRPTPDAFDAPAKAVSPKAPDTPVGLVLGQASPRNTALRAATDEDVAAVLARMKVEAYSDPAINDTASPYQISGDSVPRGISPSGTVPYSEASLRLVGQGAQGRVYRASSPDSGSSPSPSPSPLPITPDRALKVGPLESIARECAVYTRLESHGEHPCIPGTMSAGVLTSSDEALGQLAIAWVTGREIYNLCEAGRTPTPLLAAASVKEHEAYQTKVDDVAQKHADAVVRIDALVNAMYEKKSGSLTEHAQLPEPKPVDLKAKRELIAQLVCLQMAGAIAHIQNADIVFRDFQPKNFLLDDETLVVHLIDLGLADAPGGQRGLDMVGVGGYGSPPVSNERTLQCVDDTWGLVSLVWGLAQGEAPFGLKNASSEDRNMIFTNRAGNYCSRVSENLYLSEELLSPMFCDFVREILPRESLMEDTHVAGTHDRPTLETVRSHPWFQQAMERFPDVVTFARVHVP